MPETLPIWNKENLDQVISNLYAEAIRDEELHRRLMNDPYGVLNERIQIPPEYQKNFLAKLECNPGMILSVPPFQGATAPATSATTATEQDPYTIICTLPW